MTEIDGEAVGASQNVVVIDCDSHGAITLETDGVRSLHQVVMTGADTVVVQTPAGAVELATVSRFPDHASVDVAGGQISPMPGKILSVHVEVGDSVARGQTLVIMEAMKMEHTISAPGPSTVSELRCAVGDQVDNGQVLVVLDE